MSSLLVLAALDAHAADPPTVEGGVGKGLTVASADGRFSMNVRGRVQLRDSLFVAAPDDEGARELTHQTQVYTTRMWLQGHTLSKDLKYTLQLALSPRDFRDGTLSPIYDAFFDLTANPNLSLRVGQMFVPFDRLRTIREFSLQLPDRPRVVSELTLDRDVGAYLYSDHLGGDRSPLAYRLGVFGGGGPNNAGPHELGGLVVGRVELRPLGPIDDDSEGDLDRREEAGLALGVGAAYNLNTPRARSTTSTVYEGGTADYLHLAADVVFKARGFAIEGEVVYRDAAQDEIVSVDDAGAEVIEHTRSGWGAVVQPSLLLTEKVELAARYGRMTADEATDPAFVEEMVTRENELAGGLNLYLNKHRFKVQTGWSTWFGDEGGPSSGEQAANVLLDVMF
jgi:hypothetical protein